ncbi:MAG: glycosyltransferase family 2 protein [Candidatus Kapaibacterium sp.]
MLKFSIITPSYNQGRFIRDTIESILNQDYPNYEHIIIDGGSTDETIDILKEYPHLNWISEKDKGAAEAINKGFKMASGDIVTWINSDDYYEKNILSKVNNYFFDDDKLDFLYGNRSVLLPNENKLLTEKSSLLCANDLIHMSADIVRQPCSFYRMSLLRKTGLLDDTLKLVFDYELFIRMFLLTTPFYVDDTLAIQRDYSTTLTRSNMRRQAIEIYKVSRKYGAKLLDPIMYTSVLKKILFPEKY